MKMLSTIDEIRRAPAFPLPPRLTSRETDVLAAVARGHTNREIGLRLGIAAETVKRYVSILTQKFHVRNRVQLAVLVALDMPELLDRCGVRSLE